MPLRNLPPLVDTVPGASAIQQLIEWTEWTSQAGNPVAYAVHLRAQPLSGVPAKSVILQYARTDATVPNPTTSAIIRAGGLQDRTTLFRNDLAFAADPTFPKNPHTFLTRLPGLAPPGAGCRGARGTGSDRAVLRLERDGRRRSRRRRAALRDTDGRSTAGGSGLHPVS